MGDWGGLDQGFQPQKRDGVPQRENPPKGPVPLGKYRAKGSRPLA